jgi:hypothetical protein
MKMWQLAPREWSERSDPWDAPTDDDEALLVVEFRPDFRIEGLPEYGVHVHSAAGPDEIFLRVSARR